MATLPFQVDGEAGLQPPGVLSMKCLPDKVRPTYTVYSNTIMAVNWNLSLYKDTLNKQDTFICLKCHICVLELRTPL